VRTGICRLCGPANGFLDLSSLSPGHVAATLGLVQEPQTRINRKSLQDTGSSLKLAVQSRTLWIVAGFSFSGTSVLPSAPRSCTMRWTCCSSPRCSFGALGAISNAAGLLGAVLFFAYCRKDSADRLLSLAVALGVAST